MQALEPGFNGFQSSPFSAVWSRSIGVIARLPPPRSHKLLAVGSRSGTCTFHTPAFSRSPRYSLKGSSLLGAAGRVMIDNMHVVVLHGTGREMVPVLEMAAFGERFGFRLAAHEVGDAA